MRYKTVKENRFNYDLRPQTLYKIWKALWREDQTKYFFVYVYRGLKLKMLPDHVINVARSLSEEDMTNLQLVLSFTNNLSREEKYKKIEEIFTDYGLPIEGLNSQQIIGFANFVNNI